jgi:hypothetical protein
VKRALIVLGAVLATPSIVSADPVLDGFEAETIGPLWSTHLVAPGRLTVQPHIVRSGAGALRVEVREGDVAMVGADGEATERTELQEGRYPHARFGETHDYRLSMYVPPDFPIVDRRLVTVQWQQRCSDCLSKRRSPVVAQRYRRGTLFATIETPKGRQTIGRYNGAVLGQWLDLRDQIRFGFSDGAVKVWMNGHQLADYRGPLGYPDDFQEVFPLRAVPRPDDPAHVCLFRRLSKGKTEGLGGGADRGP